MFSKISVVTLTLLAAFTGVSYSAPLDVYTPPLLTPSAGAVLHVGDRVNVTWDTSNPPKQITNSSGSLYLSQNGRLLDYPNGLASGFNIMDGWCMVTVPKVPTSNNYQFILMGDSGNTGPVFTIKN